MLFGVVDVKDGIMSSVMVATVLASESQIIFAVE